MSRSTESQMRRHFNVSRLCVYGIERHKRIIEMIEMQRAISSIVRISCLDRRCSSRQYVFFFCSVVLLFAESLSDQFKSGNRATSHFQGGSNSKIQKPRFRNVGDDSNRLPSYRFLYDDTVTETF